MATTDYINQLKIDKNNLVNNLKEKGVEATNEETFTSLVPKVLDIKSGGGGTEVTKGLRIDSYDENGNITEVSILGLTEIPNYYMYYAPWFGGTPAKVNLPNGLTKIGDNAFGYSNVRDVTLPNTLITIGTNAFVNADARNIKEIPTNVTTLGNACFGWTDITEMDIKSTLITKLPMRVFYNCGSLVKLIMRRTTPPSLNSDTLQYSGIAKGKGFIYVPDEAIDAYKTATNWSTYADYIKGISELV